MKPSLLLIVCFIALRAHCINYDSLELAIVHLSPTDTIRLKSEYKIAVNCQYDDLKKSTALCERGYTNALKINSTRFQYLFLYMLGTNYQYSLDYEKSIDCFDKAINIAKSENNYARMVNCYTNLANTYNNMSYLDKATELNLLAIEISQKHVPDALWGMNYSNMGEAYIQMKDLDRGLKYIKLALTDTVLGPTDLLVVYGNLCSIYANTQQKDSAQIYYQLLMKLVQENQLNQAEDIAVSHMAYASYELNFQPTINTRNNIRQLMQACLAMDDSTKMGKAYQLMAEYFHKMKQFDSSNFYLLNACLFHQNSGDLYDLISMYDRLSENAIATNHWQQALSYSSTARRLTDSFHAIQNAKAVHNAEVKFETRQKEEKNNMLAQENELKTRQKNSYLWGGISITTLLSWFLWSNYKSRKRTEKLSQRIEEQKVALEKSNRTKDKIFSVISHDLRAPIAGLSSLMSLKESGIELDPDKQKELDQKIAQSLKNTSGSLDNLLLWSLSQMKHEKTAFQLFNLNELIQSQIDLFQIQCEAKKIQIRFSPSQNAEILQDKNGLSVILRNMLSNAIKFSYPSSKIDVHVFQKEDKICIQMKDEGVGMSVEQIQQFNQGQLQHTKGTQSETGTGLGFILIRDYCQTLGVQLAVESTPGKGTTFSILF
ncbi:MAG: tetratricopeptide repeat-containing sensor histidine kinase [Chitinophagaceae bacterium]|nr:tetratricopeptide repeat-containing sensor histidine kinase [Chitinophagaceae bacterium]